MGCPNVKKMLTWVQEESKICKPCVLAPVIQWYKDELKSRGKSELTAPLDENIEVGNPQDICKALDNIKDQVDATLRERLLDFDCAIQNNT